MPHGINHITIAVSNIQQSLDFYSDVLGFTGHVMWDSGAYLSQKDIWLCLSLDKPSPSNDYSHIALSVQPNDFHLLTQKIIVSGVKSWKQNKSEGSSFYFSDPDGHKLEIHVGGLSQRLASLKHTPYSGLKWL